MLSEWIAKVLNRDISKNSAESNTNVKTNSSNYLSLAGLGNSAIRSGKMLVSLCFS